MSYQNPYRQRLAEDKARHHWETYERCMTSLHINHRADVARERGISIEDYEEELFQRWWAAKRGMNPDMPELGQLRTSFAQFTDGVCPYD